MSGRTYAKLSNPMKHLSFSSLEGTPSKRSVPRNSVAMNAPTMGESVPPTPPPWPQVPNSSGVNSQMVALTGTTISFASRSAAMMMG